MPGESRSSFWCGRTRGPFTSVEGCDGDTVNDVVVGTVAGTFVWLRGRVSVSNVNYIFEQLLCIGRNLMTSGISKRRQLAKEEGSAAYDKRRREIVQAATKVFNEQGFRGTSLAEVAKYLKIDRASLYYYVGSKSELFNEVVREVSEINIITAESIEREQSPTPDKLLKLVRLLMESYATYFPLLYVYIRENQTVLKEDTSVWAVEMRALNRRYDHAVTAIVQAGIDDGTIRASAPAWVIAYGIIGMVNSTNRWFDPGKSKIDASEVGRAFAEMIVDGIRVR